MGVQRACDQCNFRRVKCSHEDPCHHCRRHDIQCTYVKASRGREITGRRISSLKRQHNQAFSSKTDRRRSTTDRSPSPPPSIRIPQHDSKEPASFSARRRKKGDLTIDLPDVETNTVFGQSSFQSTDGKQSFCREFYQQSVKQNHVQPVRTVPLSNPAFIPTSHLANFMESSYSKLAADPAGASRHLDTEIPLPVNLLNHMPDNVKATFPSFESFMGLPVQSIMPSSTRISQIDDWGSMHIARANSTDNTTDEESSLQNEETPPLSDSSLIPLLALYFERMHPIIPIFKRSWLFSRLDKSQHLTDIQFGALLIAMSAAALLQPVLIGNRYCIKKSNTKRAMQLLEESHRMHSSTKLGNNASIDAIMTSFYMFVILSSTGNDDAAWLRLSESVILAHIMKLHDSSAYENVDEDEREMRLRVYWLLTITERAYALQRGHSIGFRGRPGASMTAIKRKFNIGQMDDFPHSQLRLFDIVDEDFVDCWNGRCVGTECRNRDVDKAIALYNAFTNDSVSRPLEIKVLANKKPSSANDEQNSGHNVQQRSASHWQPLEIQLADVLVTRQWLLNRLWYICLSHGLIDPKAAHIALRPDFPIHIARDMLNICSKLSICSMEAHGLGLCEKLYDIARTLITVFHLFPECITSVDTEQTSNTSNCDSDGNQNERTTKEPQHGPQNAQMQLPHLLTSQSDKTSIHTIIVNVEAGLAQRCEIPLSQKERITNKHLETVASSLSSPQLKPSQLLRSASSVTDIVNAYVSLFMKLRSGSHPYLQKLLDSVQCLNAKDSVTCLSL